MTLSGDLVLVASLSYVALLFAIAFWADWRARSGRPGWLNSPLIYTLSISVYCTSWTFYGAVGSAARNGLEFATIYLGPTLVFIGWWAFMARLVRVGRAVNATSIADFLSARYGKSPALAAVATLVAIAFILPYIALQLKAVASSYQIIAGTVAQDPAARAEEMHRVAFWIAAGLAFFTIVFGTRTLDSSERQHGVVAAIAFEACVKLVALLAIGLFAIYGVAGGVGDAFANATPEALHAADAFDARWVALTFLSATAVICLPRQFQVTVVECDDPRHGRTASWAFPLYLLLTSLFVLPIALVGLETLPEGSNPDLFVLSLPLHFGESGLALLVFLGGFSSATSMAIVSCIALSTMVSNHLVAPLTIGARPADGAARDVRGVLLNVRRFSIAGIMLLGFVYLRVSHGSDALASIGLISFAGAAQFLPSIVAALYWPRATARGAIAGITGGGALWFLLLFLPSFDTAYSIVGPDMFGLSGFDPLLNALFLSLSLNTALLIGLSLSRDPNPLERLQSAFFIGDGVVGPRRRSLVDRVAAGKDLYTLAQRILGVAAADQFFAEERRRQATAGEPEADDALIARLERRLASSVGAASAHAMVSQIATGETVSLPELMRIADENARILAYSQELERTSRDLAMTARELRQANAQLQQIDAQKDAFLSTVSHELRTPMTSLRAFSEILLNDRDMPEAQRRHFLEIVHGETERLTRLLDQILDMGRLERGETQLRLEEIAPVDAIERAIAASSAMSAAGRLEILRAHAPLGGPDGAAAPLIRVDRDRFHQVLANVFSNAAKFGPKDGAKIWIETTYNPPWCEIRIADNGPGVRRADRDRIFERFGRGEDASAVEGVGLGLAISRQIMAAHGGAIDLVESEHPGACFRIRAPLAYPKSAAAE